MLKSPGGRKKGQKEGQKEKREGEREEREGGKEGLVYICTKSESQLHRWRSGGLDKREEKDKEGEKAEDFSREAGRRDGRNGQTDEHIFFSITVNWLPRKLYTQKGREGTKKKSTL